MLVNLWRRLPMKAIVCLLILLLPFSNPAYASDGFEKVECGTDIPKALIGRRTSNERVVDIEARHKALGLKDLGSDMISDHLSSVNWLICGTEYILLEDDTVRDVLPFPPHSKEAPAFTGVCQVNGKDVPGLIVAVLNYKAGAEPLTASAAWKIDEKRAKFVTMSTDGLLCPRSGIFTIDGGV
jgi:hypothetical protein